MDGDAFVILNDATMKAMVKSEGLLLKLKNKFNKLKEKSKSEKASDPNYDLVCDTSVMFDSSASETFSGNDNEVTISSSGLSKHRIIEESKIYGKGKGSNAKLTNWQKEVNKAAFSICLKSNDMLYNRAKLKLDAEEIARKTYIFQKKGGSRSIFCEAGPVPKKTCISSDEREKQIANVSQRLEEITKHVVVKQKLITQSSNTKDYHLCDKYHHQLRELMHEKQKMEAQLKDLMKKKKKHHSYVAKATTSQAKNPSSVNTSSHTDIRLLLSSKSKTGSSSEGETSSSIVTIDDSSEDVSDASVFNTDLDDSTSVANPMAEPESTTEQAVICEGSEENLILCDEGYQQSDHILSASSHSEMDNSQDPANLDVGNPESHSLEPESHFLE